ncbi:MAG: inositol monophosphatase family protein [Candidatus Thermoplasmatota archaeon]|nr:inositol monophosphatase family protein [Candidatus Thermoplasmatota archaeon]
MDEHIKTLSQQIVTKIDRKIRSTIKKEGHKLGKTVSLGADGTPTKYIDKIAEDVAIHAIKKSKMPVNLLSEEIGFIDAKSRYTIVLDPVDGTRNLYRGIPFYAVSLAVGVSMLSDITYGIVKNIATGDMFVAEKGHGAFLNNQPFVVPDVPANDLLLSLTLGKNSDMLTQKLSRHHAIRSLGCAALEMCMVAAGALDGYIVGKEFMRVTDIAASTLILREAGGIVSDLSGKPLDMFLTLDDRVGFIAAGNHLLIKSILSKSNGLK